MVVVNVYKSPDLIVEKCSAVCVGGIDIYGDHVCALDYGLSREYTYWSGDHMRCRDSSTTTFSRIRTNDYGHTSLDLEDGLNWIVKCKIIP